MKNKNKVNFTPVGNYIFTTCQLEKTDFSKMYVGNTQPKIKEIQQVIAAGPRAEVEVGDWVVVDHTRFVKHVKVKSQIRAGIGGEDMIKEQYTPPFGFIPGQDEVYLKMTDREIEGTIDDYSKLPKNFKEFSTMDEFNKAQEKALKEAEDAKKEHAKEVAKRTTKDSKGPMVITDSQRL